MAAGGDAVGAETTDAETAGDATLADCCCVTRSGRRSVLAVVVHGGQADKYFGFHFSDPACRNTDTVR